MLDVYIGTIKNYFYNMFQVPVFEKELPESLTVPSMYIPTPETLQLPYSKEKYQVNYTLDIQMFHKSTRQAMKKAEQIAQSIRANKSEMHLINADGSQLDDKIVFESINVIEMGAEGIVQLRLIWNYEYEYN